MSAPTISRAGLGDVEGVAALTGELGYDASPSEVRQRLESLLEDELHAVFVARGDGCLLGLVHVGTVKRLESSFYAELGALVVSERARRGGIGRALVGEARRWARRRGIHRLRVRTNVLREAAPRFYESLGFVEVKEQSVLDLDLV